MELSAGTFCLPGSIIGEIQAGKKLKLGPGLMQDKDYVPSQEDMVVGVVLERIAESYKVDIGAAAPATLSMLAFEGATRKNRPTLSMGSVVYARVTVANKDMEPEIACVSASQRADGFGDLTGGYIFDCTLSLATALLMGENSVLKHLGKSIPYEIAIGMNGRVWINSGTSKNTVLLANAISNSELLSDNQAKALVAAMLKASR